MTERNNGGPAFPVPPELCQDLTIEEQRGMTLRDYFAAVALQGLCAGFCSQDRNWPRDDEPEGYDVASGHAYLMADAMLKARK